jgi:hypothetical protein
MRKAIVKATVLLLGLVVATGAARAEDGASEANPTKANCINPTEAIEKLEGQASSTDKLDSSQIKKVSKAFAAAYPGTHLVDADQALVFHHAEDPRDAWLVLFKDGCAVRQGYLDEKIYRDALGLPPVESSLPPPEVGKMNAGH